jgi:hypothetical protein
MATELTPERGHGRRGRRVPRVLGVLVVFACTNAAAEWRFDPILRLAWDYDDNATLAWRTDEEESINGGIAEASFEVRNVGEQSTFMIRPLLRSRQYDSNLNRDADDQFLDLRAAWRGVRNDFRISGVYAREAVRTAELADAGLDTDIDPEEISDDETGRVGGRERRERLRIIPRWAFQLSDVSSLETDLVYLDVGYSDQDPVSQTLFDFTDTRLRVSYRRAFSTATSGRISFFARDYGTERFGGDRTGYGFSAGFDRALSQTLQVRATLGLEQVELDDPLPDTSNDPNIVGDVSLIRSGETTRLIAQYRQRIAPSGRGELVRRDEVNLRFVRDLNDRFSSGIGVRAYSINSVAALAENEQQYVQLRGMVTWRVSRTFSIEADYRYTVLDREVIGEGANSNRITVWFSWRPNATDGSRLSLPRLPT